ncbi:MAG: hypothetical protein AAF597_19195 [Bacteroidota bacterium]
MKLPFLLGITLFLAASCGQNEKIVHSEKLVAAQQIDTIPEPLPQLKLRKDTALSYSALKKEIKTTKAGLKTQSLPLDSLAHLFEQYLIDRIIPYWEQTPWSFEGHTATPGEGSIACGYFVSTTLRDLGINLNRYHLAQQGPENEAKSLALDAPILRISEANNQAKIDTVTNRLEAGVYFIGFNANHVGYLLKRNGTVYLIHANYAGLNGVEAENIAESTVFSGFSALIIVPLSNNEALLEAWVNDMAIEIYR